MGWERKRGKLAQFNHLAQSGDAAAFGITSANVRALQGVRYVITLDADTVLPPGSARALVGTMAHPLNHPFYDPVDRRVTRGYGILQPRVGVSLPSANRSRFASILSGVPGVDPYTTAVSDLYQDLFHEGSFTGKGIYDVAAFELGTNGRFPENTLLSHDLIEGNYARAGLVTDIVVYDDYPTRYLTWTRRKHRWIRGDWQLLPWLARRVPGPAGAERNRLSLLSQWKILDNLRRSVVEISALIFLLAGWTVLPGSALRWTLLVFGAIAAPWVISVLITLVRPPSDKSWRGYYRAAAEDALVSAKQAGLAITFLPHQVWTAADAIVRALYRLTVSRKHLLEWQTAQRAERAQANDRGAVRRAMRPATGSVIVVAVARHRVSVLAAQPDQRCGIASRRLVVCDLERDGTVDWLARNCATSQFADARQPERFVGQHARGRAAIREVALEFFREVRERRHSLAGAGQFPGRSDAGCCHAHVAHEHRAADACHRIGA